jgi:ATP-dependent Clp endopeptidase proteolytic subunit ClpP
MKRHFQTITAQAAPGMPEKAGIFALATATECGEKVGLIDLVGTIGVNADQNIRFADQVAELVEAGCKKMRLRINSPGGCVFTALSIFDTLKAAREKGVFVQAEVMGLAASAASFVMLAADKVIISANSQVMVHEPSTMLWGKLGELREGIQLVEKVWARMVAIYTARTGKTEAEFMAAHTKDIYYSAEEAVAAGLADEVGTGMSAPEAPAEENKAEPEPETPAMQSKWLESVKAVAARLGLLTPEPEPTAEAKLEAALAENKKILTELEGLRAQVAQAMEERAVAQQERDAAQADRARDIEDAVAARVAGMGMRAEELPPAENVQPVEEAPAVRVLEADAVVRGWLAGGDYGRAVSYACQSSEHMAQVHRLRRNN